MKTKNKASRIRYAGGVLRDLFFPPECAACGELIEAFREDGEIFCPACGKAWDTAVREAAALADEGRVYLVGYRTGHTDGVPERLIYRLKHARDARVFAAVSAALAEKVSARLLSEGVDPADAVILYTPRRASAVAKDGFDQAKLLASGVAKAMGAVCLPALARVGGRHERAQKELDAEARRREAGKAYRLREKLVPTLRGRTVVLVDDLRTTGSTLDACAALLLSAGAARVLSATVGQTAR